MPNSCSVPLTDILQRDNHRLDSGNCKALATVSGTDTHLTLKLMSKDRKRNRCRP
jgi:hypothetical protein